MTNDVKFYVAEYSKSQGCFHVESLAEALATNRRIVAARAGVDYIPFALCESAEAANEACNTMDKLQRRCGGSRREDQLAAFEHGTAEEDCRRVWAETERLERAERVVACAEAVR